MKRKEFDKLKPSCTECVYYKAHYLMGPNGLPEHLCYHPCLMYFAKLDKRFLSVDCIAMREQKCGVEGKYFNL